MQIKTPPLKIRSEVMRCVVPPLFPGTKRSSSGIVEFNDNASKCP